MKQLTRNYLRLQIETVKKQTSGNTTCLTLPALTQTDPANFVYWQPLLSYNYTYQSQKFISHIPISPFGCIQVQVQSVQFLPNPYPKSKAKLNPASESVKSVPFKARLGARSHPAANIFQPKLICSSQTYTSFMKLLCFCATKSANKKELRINTALLLQILKDTIANIYLQLLHQLRYVSR